MTSISQIRRFKCCVTYTNRNNDYCLVVRACLRAYVCFFSLNFSLLFMIIVLVLFWLFSHHFVEWILYYRYRYRHDRHRSYVRCVYYFFVWLHNFANVLAWSNFSAVLKSIDWCFVARLLIINAIDGLVTSNDVSILYWSPPYDNVQMHFTSIIHLVRYLHFTTIDWIFSSKKLTSIWNRIVGINRKSGKKRIKIYH